MPLVIISRKTWAMGNLSGTVDPRWTYTDGVLKSMSTQKETKTKSQKRKAAEDVFGSKPPKCNPHPRQSGKTKPKRDRKFLFMVAPERALYEFVDKGKFSFNVVSTKNHEIVIPQSTQRYSRRIDMIGEINRLWPHTAIDQTSINDR